MNNWVICYVLRDGIFEWSEAGRNIVVSEEVDKVIPVEEHVARQAEKLIYDGKKLKLRDGETLLTKKELDDLQTEEDIANGLIDKSPSEPKLVEVEM